MAKWSTLGSPRPPNAGKTVATTPTFSETCVDRLETTKLKSTFFSWFTVAIAAVVAQVIVSLTVKEPALNIWCAAINFFLLVVAAGVTTRNAVLSEQAIRLFWSFLAAAYWVWAIPPCVWFYYSVLHGMVPNLLLMTFPWFLHIVLMIAAMAARPHLKVPSQRPYGVTLNFLMVLFLLIFAYAYLLFPDGYLPGFPVVMRRWAAMYSGENLILLVALATLIVKSQPPWKAIYWHLLGASTLYAFASEFAHLVFASSGRFTDGLVAVPFNVSTAWFVWVSLKGRKQALELALTVQPDTSDRRHASLLAMLAVVAIPLVGIFELFRPDEPHLQHLIRLLIVLISVVLLAVVAFIQDYLSNRELVSDVSIAKDRLRLAVESGKSVVWDWDVRSGQSSWYGDLQTMFGIQSATFVGHVEDFRRYLHPDDREQVSEAIRRAMQNHAPYAGEFRIAWPDGTVRHVAATGKCYYAPNGQPERMLGVTVDVTERKQTEQKLRESEKRFRVMADTTPSLIWMCDREGKITYLNERRVAFTGTDSGAGYGDTWTAYVHPDDLKNVQNALAWALKRHEPFSKEYRLRRRDGVYRWMFDVASPRVNGDGSFAGLIGSAIDMTDQRLAQEALEKVGGRLLEAQEEERRRIARELHDDISQKLAVLAMELVNANRKVSGSPEVTKAHLEEIRRHCSDIGRDVQSLSHQLHNSKLDYLGLVGALKGFCREFAQQYDVRVAFTDENVPRELPRNISLCLFRVTQEALYNAVKYSGTREFGVRLTATGDVLQLVVSDAGRGFDLAEAMKNQGLGLVSMQERVRLIQGRFNIDSRSGEGTKIVATVPVTGEKARSLVDRGSERAPSFHGAA